MKTSGDGEGPATASDTFDSDIECGFANIIGTKRKKVETTEWSGELESLKGIREPVVELESLELCKSKCCELSGVKTRKNAAKDETERAHENDAIEYWRKMFVNLESRVVRIEDEVSTIKSVLETRVVRIENEVSTIKSLLESLIESKGNGNSMLRYVDLHNREKIDSEALGFQNEVTQSGVKQRDENNRSKSNAPETSSGERKDIHVCELKTEKKVLDVCDVGIKKHCEAESEFPKYSAVNISSGSLHLSCGGENDDEGNGWSCEEKRASQGQLEPRKKSFVNTISDDCGESYRGSFAEDSDSSTDSKGSLGDLMEILAMKYRNRTKEKEIKWKFEADMLSSFEEDPELCMKAVCALYRQLISEDVTSDKGLFHYCDALRVTFLAKFLLMDGDCNGDLNKSVEELEVLDSEAVEDCKRLARSYSKQLFSIYQHRKDPYFLPSTTDSHGD